MSPRTCRRLLNSILFGLMSLTLLFFSACSDGGEPVSGRGVDGRVHARAWDNPANKTAPSFHGRAVATQGTVACTSCHGLQLEGSGALPGCRKCHFSDGGGRVPPGVTWTHGAIPHSDLLAFGETCNACHAVNRANGLPPDNCHDCHLGATHPTGRPWLDPASGTFHGTQAQAGLDACRQCHGQDLTGGLAETGCDGCHFGPTGSQVPPGSTWSHGSLPHDGFTGSQVVCNSCHDLLRSFTQGPSPCHDCHTTATHPLGQAWIDRDSATFHGATAKADSSVCAPCHGSDFQGGTSGVSCYQCHFGPTGTRVPAGVNWTHGTIPHDQPELTAAVANCDTCHALSRLYNNGPSPCHDCHLGATHPLGQAWVDQDSSTFHGNAAQAGLDGCRSCHGSDLLGGVSGISCDQCHFGPAGSKVPPGATWTHGTVPHDTLSGSVAVCNACHEVSRLYGNGPSPCHDCHVGATHPLGQAWLDRDIATFHGAAARQNSAPCQTCHGLDLKGGSAGVSCEKCHFGPTGTKVPPLATWTHGAIPHSQFTAFNAVCEQCHGVSRLYGNGPNTCHDCHAGANHPLGQTWVDSGVAGYHGDAARQGVDGCTPCHGSDFQGGNSGVSCGQCHFGPTGTKMPHGVAWTHGTIPHDNLAPYVAVCNFCHTLERSYGDGPASCHDCHLGATHPLGQAWLSPASASFHGPVARQNPDSCTPCHGSDYLGGSSGVSCSNCHFGPMGAKVPNGVVWSHGTIPHGTLSPYLATCNQCHALERSFGTGPASCHDCHVSATHSLGQVWLDPRGAGFHGNAAQQNVDSCRQCHGSDFQGGSSTVSCYQCHFGPTGNKVPGGVVWTHGTLPHAALAAYIATCNACHTLERGFGIGPASCHDCHGSGMHPTGQVWLDSASASFHGDAATANLDSCRGCHGLNLDGGTASVSCSQCHFGPGGSRVPPAVTWVHGAAHPTLGNYEATCTQCHTLTRQFRNLPTACHDCHGTGAPHETGASWLLPNNHAQQSIDNRGFCLACHNLSGAGGTDPTCRSCHTAADPPLSLGNCTSCHGRPPSSGNHSDHRNEATCSTCHNGYGSGSLSHFYPVPAPPANIAFALPDPGDNMTATFNATGSLLRCFNTCHGENHGSSGRSW